MKKIFNILGVVALLSVMSFQLFAQTKQPTFSYKIELKTDGWYYAYFKSDKAFSTTTFETTISTIQYTLVAPLGTFGTAGTNSATNKIIQFEDQLPSSNPTDYSWQKQRTDFNTTNEYAFFALSASATLINIPVGTDVPMFRFKTAACIGPIRLYRNVTDASGAADGKKNNSPNSFYISGLSGGLDEAYKANYGNEAVCPATPVPDLITSINVPATIVINTPFNYAVAVTNIGNATSTGAVTEVFTIQSGLTYNSGGGNGWTCTPATGPVVGPTSINCLNPNPALAITNGSSNFLINVTPTANTTFTLTAVISGGGEAKTDNNSATSNSTIIGGCGINAGTLTRN